MAQAPGSTAVAERPANPFGNSMAPSRAGGLISVEQQRAIAQVQAAMIVARSMPRDRAHALDLILLDCTDPQLAEEAEYEYSRGGTKISGPSIRLLETVARRWGNLESGIKEISRHEGYSEFEAYAWDMESNWRDSKTFQVRHWRDTEKKGGTGYAVTAERDIYEVGANMGARRKRACMEAVIPADVIRQASEECQRTLKNKVQVTQELIEDMLEKFVGFGVTKEMIEKRIQRRIDAMTPGIAIQLRRIYNSLKDGMSGPGDWFEMAPAADQPQTGAAGLKSAVVGGQKGKGGAADGDQTNVDRSTGEITETPIQKVTRICSAAVAIKEKQVAHLKLDDARFEAKDLTGDEKAAADQVIRDAAAQIDGKLV